MFVVLCDIASVWACIYKREKKSGKKGSEILNFFIFSCINTWENNPYFQVAAWEKTKKLVSSCRFPEGEDVCIVPWKSVCFGLLTQDQVWLRPTTCCHLLTSVFINPKGPYSSGRSLGCEDILTMLAMLSCTLPFENFLTKVACAGCNHAIQWSCFTQCDRKWVLIN